MKNITEIIEIVFERIPLEKVVEYLMKILSDSTLINSQISSDSCEINLKSSDILFNSINQSSDGSFYFNFINFSLNGVLLSRVGFQIYKYNNYYDLNLHIEEKEISQIISISNLHKSIETLATNLIANNYYCGYEPAVDEDTRLFSGSQLGPLKDWGNID